MTEDTERAQVDWGRFRLAWVLVSTVALLVALPARQVVGIVKDVAVDPAGVRIVFWIVVGAAVGIAQWLVLRREISRAGWWVIASPVGAALGFAVIVAMVGVMASDEEEAAGSVVAFAVLGAAIGIAQWFVLRREVSRAGWWILASTVGCAGGRAVTLAAIELNKGGMSFLKTEAVAVWVLGLAAYGAITGSVLIWLLRPPVTEEPPEYWP